MTLLLTAWSILALLFWLFVAGVAIAGQLRVRWLRDVTLPEGPMPRLAVIMPARDEEKGIRAALESLLRQDYPDLIVLPVDDRSADRTGAIMAEVAAAAPGRVYPVHVRELPPEWLGKNHANAVGAREARKRGADWMLFTDGDVVFEPQALRKAVAYARERGLSHLAVGPELVFHTFAEGVLLASFFLAFVVRFRPWFVEDPRSKGYVGIGAFNMIRADAHEAIGGHERLALTVAEDVALGRLVRDAGLKRAFLSGEGEVRVAWQPSLLATIRGLYKNSFASLDFSMAKNFAAIAFVLALQVATYVLPAVTDGPAQVVAAVALALQMGVHAHVARAALLRPLATAIATGLCAGFGALLFCWIMFGSMLVTLRQGGVVWRGTLYPTSLLRDRQVRV